MAFYFTIYIFIGLGLMFIIQYINDKLTPKEDAVSFNIVSILFGIMIWPLIVVVFIRAFKK
jgi:hypothetical protein